MRPPCRGDGGSVGLEKALRQRPGPSHHRKRDLAHDLGTHDTVVEAAVYARAALQMAAERRQKTEAGTGKAAEGEVGAKTQGRRQRRLRWLRENAEMHT